jgi:hypothetical protein
MVEEEGLILSEAKSNELFIDLDDVDDLEPFFKRIQRIHRLFKPIAGVYQRRSKGGKGWHIRVVMSTDIDLKDRVVLHLIAGSDPVRELLRLRAIHDKSEDQPSIFLDKPDHPETKSEVSL